MIHLLPRLRMMIHGKLTAALPIVLWTLASLTARLVMAADTDNNLLKNDGSLDRLFKQAGVYNASSTGKTPGFVVDPAWPQPLPNNWLLGQIGGLYVDPHDHIWVYNRPRTMTNEEAGLEGPVPGAVNARRGSRSTAWARCAPMAPSQIAAKPLLRCWSLIPRASCCVPGVVPPTLALSAANARQKQAASGPAASTEFMSTRTTTSGSREIPRRPTAEARPGRRTSKAATASYRSSTWTATSRLRIGGTPTGPDSNDTHGGVNGTPLLYQAADMVVDPATNRLYIADGYGDRRVLIVDADTGKYIGHFGAYGNNPVDDAAAAAAGTWIEDYAKGNKKPAFFRNPVHCVKIAHDGKLYVCDRGNDRIQVFDIHDPALGKPCSNPAGVSGKCGFVAEQFVSEHTNIIGTAVSLNFSKDDAQSCLYIGDNANMTIYVLNRSNLQELGRLGRSGRMPGDFHWLHQVSLDSKGNIYTGEVDTGKRIQKFLRYGSTGCSGTGSSIVGGPIPTK